MDGCGYDRARDGERGGTEKVSKRKCSVSGERGLCWNASVLTCIILFVLSIMCASRPQKSRGRL